MLTIAQALHQGVEYHKRGELAPAERLYRQVLEADARNADAWHLLGLIAQARGDAPTAIDYIGRAIKLDGGQPIFHNHLGEAYRTLSRLSEAEQSCRQALRLKEDFAVARNTLGMILNQQGRFEEALVTLRRAVEVEPRFALPYVHQSVALRALGRPDEALAACRAAIACDPGLALAYQELGRILREQGKTGEAMEAYRDALRVNPKSAAAECYLGALLQIASRRDEAIACYRRALAIDPKFADAHCNLGNALGEIGQAAEAAQCYQRALQCNPRLAEAHYNLGVLWQDRGQVTAAIECYRNAIRFKPDCAPAYNNLGTVYRLQGDLAGAKECYAKALEFQPNFAEAFNNLGNVLKIEGRIAEARVCYQQTLRTHPQHAQAHCNLGLLHLADGEFAAGWPEYEYRRACPDYRKRSFDRPQWQGEALAGRRLLVHAEQGLGDTLQFVRYLPLVAERGGNVVFEVQRALIPLLQRSPIAGAAELVPRDDPLPDFDLYVPLLSLPGIFGTTLDTIPARGGYLSADPQLVEHWRGVLGDRPPLRVGIAWQGSSTYLHDRFRSIPLAEFAALALGGVELVSLQKGPGAEQLTGVKFRVRELGPDFDETHGAFMDTAAVMKNLDLVVTSDTATAHLAAALGVEAWVALMTVPDWRWMYDRPDSPWYATLRLFRQTRLGEWPSVFERMAQALSRRNRAG